MRTVSEEKNKHLLKEFVAGGCGGMLMVAVGFPLDTIKVVLQNSRKSSRGVISVIKEITLSKGLKGFFAGLTFPLFGTFPVVALTFTGYGLGLNIQAGRNNEQYTSKQIFIAGLLGGLFPLPIVVPGERIKCLLQTDNQRRFTGPFNCLKLLWQKGGSRALFKGLSVTVLRDMPGTGIWYVSYEKFRHVMLTETKPFPALEMILAGGMAGAVAWLYIIPFDVVKTRVQTEYPDNFERKYVTQTAKSIFKNESLFGFFKGLSAVFLRAFPTSAACFFGYESTMYLLNK